VDVYNYQINAIFYCLLQKKNTSVKIILQFGKFKLDLNEGDFR